MIRIKNLVLSYKHTEQDMRRSVLKVLGINPDSIGKINIIKKSIDARKRRDIHFVYNVDVVIADELESSIKLPEGAEIVGRTQNYIMPLPPKNKFKIVVVGSGPCGLFTALILAQLGCKPIVIERGEGVEQRAKAVYRFWTKGELNTECNVQFGEGGAGTFSDGKLASQIKDKLCRSRKVLEELVEAGTPEDILYQAKPHIGTDKLITVVRNIRKKIIALGGQVHFNTKLTAIEIQNGCVCAAITDKCSISAEKIVLAIGHSSRDTFEMLANQAIAMQAKPFSLGVRIEHPQELINKSRYNISKTDRILSAADYKLVHHCSNGRSAYTFCMCPGGEVIASSSETGMVVTNGMSVYSRNRENANSALLVGVGVDDFAGSLPLAGVEFQRVWERKAYILGGGNYYAPVQRVSDFLANRASKQLGRVKPSYKPGVRLANLSDCLPDFVVDTLREAIVGMDKKLKGFALPDAVMTAVESRSSSPVRILRDESMQSINISGLYPAGEGAGYAGGIMSAAIDGIKIAESIAALG